MWNLELEWKDRSIEQDGIQIHYQLKVPGFYDLIAQRSSIFLDESREILFAIGKKKFICIHLRGKWNFTRIA